MPQSPLLVGAAAKTSALESRVSALMCENRDRAEYGEPGSRDSPDETNRDLSGETSAIEAK